MTGVMLDRNAEFIPPDRQIAQPERNKFRVPENVRCALPIPDCRIILANSFDSVDDLRISGIRNSEGSEQRRI
jgi:hypothetical protein